MDLRLANGLEVTIRPIRPDDKQLLASAHGALSDESVRRRFLAPKPRLAGGELRYLTEVDFTDHYAVVAVRRRGIPVILGVGRWIRDPLSPQQAEAAIVVGDELHGLGLGTALGTALADAARARGIRRFTATMLSDNAAALRLFAAISERLDVTHDGATEQVVARLAA